MNTTVIISLLILSNYTSVIQVLLISLPHFAVRYTVNVVTSNDFVCVCVCVYIYIYIYIYIYSYIYISYICENVNVYSFSIIPSFYSFMVLSL